MSGPNAVNNILAFIFTQPTFTLHESIVHARL